MSVEDVKNRWGLYNSVIEIMMAAMDGKVALGGNVPKLPKDTTTWSSWVDGVNQQRSQERIWKITKEALQNATDILTAAHDVAAKVTVPAPKAETVEELIAGLENLNEKIKKDQTFKSNLAAAADIAEAVAGEMKRRYSA